MTWSDLQQAHMRDCINTNHLTMRFQYLPLSLCLTKAHLAVLPHLIAFLVLDTVATMCIPLISVQFLHHLPLKQILILPRMILLALWCGSLGRIGRSSAFLAHWLLLTARLRKSLIGPGETSNIYLISLIWTTLVQTISRVCQWRYSAGCC